MPQNLIQHIEWTTRDAQHLRAFYSRIFDWKFRDAMPGYTMIEGVGGIFAAPDTQMPIVITPYVNVRDLGETEAKVSGTTLTRDTQIDLQHCSATVSQACTNNSDCEAASCPTCQPKEFCLTSDHCSGSQSLVIGCTSDRDCQAPRCKICEPNETCVKVLPASQIFLAPGDSVDLIETNVSLINVLTTPAKVKETWTVHSFNAGDASDGLRYRIQPRPDVKPPTP